jgi:hypothetical protein
MQDWIHRMQWCIGAPLILVGCTGYIHEPPVTLEQHRVDLEACRMAVRYPAGIPTGLGLGNSGVAVATSAVGVAASEVDNFNRESAIIECMKGRGYRAGLTFNPYGCKTP